MPQESKILGAKGFENSNVQYYDDVYSSTPKDEDANFESNRTPSKLSNGIHFNQNANNANNRSKENTQKSNPNNREARLESQFNDSFNNQNRDSGQGDNPSINRNNPQSVSKTKGSMNKPRALSANINDYDNHYTGELDNGKQKMSTTQHNQNHDEDDNFMVSSRTGTKVRTNTQAKDEKDLLNSARGKTSAFGLPDKQEPKNEGRENDFAYHKDNNKGKINFDKPILSGYVGIVPNMTGNELNRTVKYLKGGVALRVTRSAEIDPHNNEERSVHSFIQSQNVAQNAPNLPSEANKGSEAPQDSLRSLFKKSFEKTFTRNQNFTPIIQPQRNINGAPYNYPNIVPIRTIYGQNQTTGSMLPIVAQQTNNNIGNAYGPEASNYNTPSNSQNVINSFQTITNFSRRQSNERFESVNPNNPLKVIIQSPHLSPRGQGNISPAIQNYRSQQPQPK